MHQGIMGSNVFVSAEVGPNEEVAWTAQAIPRDAGFSSAAPDKSSALRLGRQL